jgi:hypothetical protein
MTTYIPFVREPFIIDNTIDKSQMTCKGFFEFTLQNIIDSFGESECMEWRISTYFQKDLMIIYNSLIKTCFLYGNCNVTYDNLDDISEYIKMNCQEEIPDLDLESDTESDFESDTEDVVSIKISKTNYNIFHE